MTPQQPLPSTAPAQPTAPMTAQGEKAAVGKTLDHAQLRQVGGGNTQTPVRCW